MNRSDCLREASSLICGPRHEDYGEAKDNFTRIASYWSVRLGIKVTAVDVADCLALMKMARGQANPAHTDSAVDACGYLALRIEIATGDSASDRQRKFSVVSDADLPVEPGAIGTGVD